MVCVCLYPQIPHFPQTLVHQIHYSPCEFVKIGPPQVDRTASKLLEQQVNLFLAQTDICTDENFILPKSMHVCMIRFEGIASIARGGEGLHQEEPKVMIIHGCAREEREAGAREEEEIIEDMKKDVQAEEAGADYPAPFLHRIIRP